MSSDIWHYHQQQQHHHHQASGLAGVLSGAASRAKGSRSVLAMPNHFGEQSRVADLAMRNKTSPTAAAAPGAQLQQPRYCLQASGAPARRPTYCGLSTALNNGSNNLGEQQQQLLEENPMSSEQQQQQLNSPVGDELMMAGAADQPGSREASHSPADSQQVAGGQNKQHAGPMGIFFKVWSLVKVTKGKHQQRQQQRQSLQLRQQQNGRQIQYRLERQNSEDNSNYMAADFAAHQRKSASMATILQDQHFRRAGSQPAASALDRLQVSQQQQTTPTSSSSGVSSTTSSTLAANSSNSPTTSSSSSPFRRTRRNFNAKPQQQQQESWVTRMRRGASNSNHSGDGGAANLVGRAPRVGSAVANSRLRRHSSGQQQQQQPAAHLLSLSLSTSDGSRSSSEPRDEPEDEGDEGLDQIDRDIDEDAGDEEEEEESNDIYSTPNDSIQSVPSGQRAAPLAASDQRQTTSREAYPIIKSFSTNNFQQALAQQLRVEQQQQQKQKPQPERKNSSDSGNRKQRLSGSRLFISSSSSEDSQATKQQQQLPPSSSQQPALPPSRLIEHHAGDNGRASPTDRQQHRRSRVSISQGVHCHAAGAAVVRPQSLILATTSQDQQFLVPMQMLTPVGGIGVASPSTTTTVYLGSSCLRTSVASGTGGTCYQRSPSIFEFPFSNTRFSSKFPPQVSSFQQQRLQQLKLAAPSGGPNSNQSRQSIDSNAAKFSSSSTMIPHSISMYDFKQTSQSAFAAANQDSAEQQANSRDEQMPIEEGSEYKLAEMMLQSGSNPNARDSLGNTPLMLAVRSDNLPAVKCLIEHGANLNETNSSSLGSLDLVCARQATPARLEMLKTLIDSGVDLDRQRESDGSRLLDRLIREHHQQQQLDRMPFVECLLESGAKLSSSTWSAAQGKLEIQLSLLRKLCQDGYFLYKQCSIEAAVYRFEYALRRIAELEQQLSQMMTNLGAGCNQSRRKQSALIAMRMATTSGCVSPENASIACRKIKYQTYLGLSRCERRRKFYKRALEFAQLAILVDSTSYEAFYSKAHTLKDQGQIDDSLLTIDQTARLMEKTIENCKQELKFLGQQGESLIMDTCFDMDRELCRNQSVSLARSRTEVQANLDYLEGAREYVAKLRQDIMEEKFKHSAAQSQKQGNQITSALSEHVLTDDCKEGAIEPTWCT